MKEVISDFRFKTDETQSVSIQPLFAINSNQTVSNIFNCGYIESLSARHLESQFRFKLNLLADCVN